MGEQVWLSAVRVQAPVCLFQSLLGILDSQFLGFRKCHASREPHWEGLNNLKAEEEYLLMLEEKKVARGLKVGMKAFEAILT